ncbi:hypothetical protein RBSH_03429 [Rhodopirellula baltica SH28]|uniref:Uncharacterized protein n=2 Tax=Rhodopirellula baltica TaxID=265606 RepID=F2AX76_RHOBT|nr:hypothetical protein RBWH47_05112 [Rhodopirellula baltica WH47]EKK01190.1 hypothetical protein RBSH_03429 [Rhodopirellula baltica SH28]
MLWNKARRPTITLKRTATVSGPQQTLLPPQRPSRNQHVTPTSTT